MTTEEENNKTSLKLIVDTSKNKVVFAEANGSFVNTLFSIMTMPMSTLIRVLDKCPNKTFDPFASLKNLYQSLTRLSTDHFSNEECKHMILDPKTSAYSYCRKLKLQIDDFTEATKFFVCENETCSKECGNSYFSTCSVARCCYCGKLMNKEIEYKDMCGSSTLEIRDDGVFVADVASFIVTDDLHVMPNTLDSSFRLLGDLGFTDASELEERTIEIGREQILILVKAALLLKYPLTYLVFNSIRLTPDSVEHLTINEEDTNLKTMRLKLTLQRSTSKFLFAEADEDFVDFLFSFMEIPFGTLIGKLMKDDTSLKCFHNLFESISNMSVRGCIRSHCVKNMLIRPQLVWKYVSKNQIFPVDATDYSRINYRSSFVDGTIKRYINGVEKYNMRFKDPRVEERFLKAGTKFMVLDDLVVKPLSTVSAIGILNKSNVPLNDVEHHVVTIGIEKAMKILKASLKSDSILTDVLLGEIIKKKVSSHSRPTLPQASTQPVMPYRPTTYETPVLSQRLIPKIEPSSDHNTVSPNQFWAQEKKAEAGKRDILRSGK